MTARRAVLAFMIGALLGFLAATAGAQDVPKDIRTDLGAPPVQPLLPLVSQYAAPVVYEQWWREIAACEQLPLPPEHFQVRFFAVNATRFVDLLRPQFGYDIFVKRIVVMWALASSYLDDGSIFVAMPYKLERAAIAHEMLHHLMRWAGEPAGHPPARFERSDCGVSTVYRRPPS